MKKAILILILLVSVFFRFWDLAGVPPSASLDEASITYNAYSVLKTGTDEFGEFPLISQRGYDDWRRSTYLLIEVPFVAVFGLSTLAARLPAAILSVLTVLAIFGIATLIFSKKDKLLQTFPFIAASLLAISPWHIYISRLGHESNASLSFIVFGIYFFLKGIKTKKLYLVFSAIFFLLGMISYYSGQIFVPVLVSVLAILYRKDLFEIVLKDTRTKVTAIVIAIATIVVFWSVFSPNALIRFRGTSVFDPGGHGNRYAKLIESRNDAVERGDLLGSVIYNRRFFYVQVWLEGYLSHFKPSWLFEGQGDTRFKVPNSGLLYYWQFPFIILGGLYIIRTGRIDRRMKAFIIVWFLLGALPPSVATQTPHAMRNYNIVPVWQLLTGFGCLFLLNALERRYKVVLGILGFLILTSCLTLYSKYFVDFPRRDSQAYQYALSKAVVFVSQNQSKYDKIIFSNRDSLYQSYMLFLYHSKFDPVEYKSYGGTDSAGYDKTHSFGKFEFRPIEWNKENQGNNLYVGNTYEIPNSDRVLYTGRYLDGTIGIRISEK